VEFIVSDEPERRIPVIQERARIDKKTVEGVVAISTSIKHDHKMLTETLRRDEIDIRRVSVERTVEEMPDIRQEGDVTVIPIVEERAVVVKHLVLVEELHVRRRAVERIVQVPANLRATEISVERHGSPSGGQT
jgi:uncharacterized protein (TIGR02271 family)